MRQPTPREWFYLAVLGTVLVGVFWFRGGDGLIGGGGAEDRAAREIGEAPVVRLSLLDRPPDEFTAARDLFQYGPPPHVPRAVPTPRPVQPVQRQPPVRQPPVRTAPPVQVAPQPSTPQPPRPKFVYLGYLGPKDDRIAVFEEGDMILARAGEVVQKEFRVLEFKYETVVLGYTNNLFDGQTTELRIRTK